MSEYDGERQQATVFKRRRFSAPHRRRRLWVRMLRPLAAAAILVGIPLVIVYWSLTAPLFAVDELAISGGGRVAPAWAAERLQTIRGRSILTLRLAEVEVLLANHPWLRGVEVSKQLPSRLEVGLLDRQSVALLKSDDELFFLDDGGEIIAPYDRFSGAGDYVVIVADARESDAIREALALSSAWSRSAGSWAEGLSEVEVVGATSFRVYCRDLEFPLLVSREYLAPGLEALREYLPTVRSRYPDLEVADLRFSGQIVFQPAGESATEG
ncbi:MAG: FtsQ-type POTRA domain-containing protein [Acidobacteriota bacterium]|nr:FtsQ-type POTRA domain-containing protein [Acidobacteriota bacterium]